MEDRKLPASCIPWPLPSFRCTAMLLNNSTDITMWKRKKERQLRSIEMHFLASTRFCKVQNNIAEVCISSQYSICREMYFNALLCCNKVDLAEAYTFISFFACVGRFLCFCRHLKGRRRQRGPRKWGGTYFSKPHILSLKLSANSNVRPWAPIFLDDIFFKASHSFLEAFR